MKRANALWNCRNPNQGAYTKILCLCSAGLLRSPTLAGELYKRGYNTRAAGVHDYALVEVDEVLVEWADKIIAVEQSVMDALLHKFPEAKEADLVVLSIPDKFPFRDGSLVRIINEALDNEGF